MHDRLPAPTQHSALLAAATRSSGPGMPARPKTPHPPPHPDPQPARNTDPLTPHGLTRKHPKSAPRPLHKAEQFIQSTQGAARPRARRPARAGCGAAAGGSHDVKQEGRHVGEADETLHAPRGGVHDEQPPHARHRQPLHHRPARRARLTMACFGCRAPWRPHACTHAVPGRPATCGPGAAPCCPWPVCMHRAARGAPSRQ